LSENFRAYFTDAIKIYKFSLFLFPNRPMLAKPFFQFGGCPSAVNFKSLPSAVKFSSVSFPVTVTTCGANDQLFETA